jgi:putative transposase
MGIASVIKIYKYKMIPNAAQRERLATTLELCREVYNLCLEQRKMRRMGHYEQMKEITQLRREFPQFQFVFSDVLQDIATRLQLAFEKMWRNGGGYLRFKNKDHYNSFKYKRKWGHKLSGRYLQLTNIGNIKLHLSRPIPEDAVTKNLIVKRTINGWFACFVINVKNIPLPDAKSVGIDLGIENLAALSDGSFVANPRFFQSSQAKLRRAQRRVARAKRGSRRRAQAVRLLAKEYRHTQDQRADYAHKQTTSLVRRYGAIVIENLGVCRLAKSRLSKQVHDAGWGQFVSMLGYKAESAGRRLIEVNPNGTSQECPACGAIKKKKLSERQHKCACGYEVHRDTAAAQVILGRFVPSGANLADVIA